MTTALPLNIIAVALAFVASATALVLVPHQAHAQIPVQPPDHTNYRAHIQEWRQNYEQRLKASDGWLSLAGLHWLNEGDNWVGTLPSSTIRLPKLAQGISVLGNFQLHNGTVKADFAKDVPVTVLRSDGSAFEPSTHTLRSDSAVGGADLVSIGSLTLFVIKRGTRFALRVRDAEQPKRLNFPGCLWFPVSQQWRVRARFVVHAEPRTLPIVTIVGDAEPAPNPGYVVFSIGGREYRLEAQDTGKRLFFNFKDATNSGKTYSGGRFLYADKPDADGWCWLDFNKAYNPPCAYTAFATCPLPPRENVLSVRILAGELAPRKSVNTDAHKPNNDE